MKKSDTNLYWGILFISMGTFCLIPKEIIPEGVGWLLSGLFSMIYASFENKRRENKRHLLFSLGAILVLIGVGKLLLLEMSPLSLLFIGVGTYLMVSRDKNNEEDTIKLEQVQPQEQTQDQPQEEEKEQPSFVETIVEENQTEKVLELEGNGETIEPETKDNNENQSGTSSIVKKVSDLLKQLSAIRK